VESERPEVEERGGEKIKKKVEFFKGKMKRKKQGEEYEKGDWPGKGE